MDIQQILIYLTPFIIYGVGVLVAKVKPLIPGWAMVSVVSALSAAAAYLSTLAASPELVWYFQFVYGLGAIVVHQIVKQFSTAKRKLDAIRLRNG